MLVQNAHRLVMSVLMHILSSTHGTCQVTVALWSDGCRASFKFSYMILPSMIISLARPLYEVGMFKSEGVKGSNACC